MLKKSEFERKKQLLVLGASILLIGAGLYLFNRITSPEREVSVPKIELEEETRKDEERILKEVYGKKILELETKIEELKRMLKEKEGKEEVPLRIPPPVSQVPQPQQPIQPISPPPPPPPPPEKPRVKVLENLIEVVKPPKDEKREELKEEKKEVSKKVIIPKGSFVKAVLLSGLDAPAGGKAISNPHPVLLKITDKAILPNFWKVDIKDCFFLGFGYGDLSSERAYIRIENLSCVKEDGSVVEKKVEGFVAGEDGKEGLRGRVVTRQGALLARALVAGFLEGISQAFAQSNTSVIVSPQGALTTVKPSQVFSVGISGGFAKAAEKLADFYMKLATQMFPVIEINAGRKVDVVFLSSVSFGGEDEGSDSTSESSS
ncbi:TraB/VirB10 family protein [Aquifex sp.]